MPTASRTAWEMAAARARRESRGTGTSSTRMPVTSSSSAVGSSFAASSRCGRPRSLAETTDVGAGGGGVDALEDVTERRVALLQGGEDAAAVVGRDDDREVGTRLAGSDEQGIGVVQEGQVADVGEGAARRTSEGGSDRGRQRAVDSGQAAVRDHETPLPHRVRAGDEVEVADRVRRSDHQQSFGRDGVVDGTGDLQRGTGGLPVGHDVDGRCGHRIRRAPGVEPRGRRHAGPARRPGRPSGRDPAGAESDADRGPARRRRRSCGRGGR